MLIRRLNDSFLSGAADSPYATAFLASFYSESGELLFTNAGHLPPLWYRAATREWSLMYDSTPYSKEILDLPLGLIAGTSYSQTAVQLEMGDLLLLYTDGISESWNESGEQLGLEGLLSIARSLPTESAAAAGQGLLSAIQRFRGAAPAADDETVVALNWNAGKARTDWKSHCSITANLRTGPKYVRAQLPAINPADSERTSSRT
jgi:sigma-B regulation protein RsbU (phosphoserine phosphatase)